MLCTYRIVSRRVLCTSSAGRRQTITRRCLHATTFQRSKEPSAQDPRLPNDVDDLIEDKFAVLKSTYDVPKHPIILAHGLLGFDELHLAGKLLPGVEYWYGITQALAAKNVEVITASVPPSGSIEVRAARLAEVIERKANGKAVNIIAHSMPPNVKVLSLTTVATPHRGSSFADFVFKGIGVTRLPKLYKALEFVGVETGAFKQLTCEYMAESFNPRTPDDESVQYYSYGADFQPHLMSVFRKSHNVIQDIEGPNDGLVSVQSSRWGTYKGTLNHVNHLDLINWTNRLRWYIWELTGKKKRTFNAIAFYLSIADMLAKEGL
ncbi:unnamed protein product [Zymoseptoria tritici ST99CH_1E4]|uniref:DUF676 domain-containing protein n=1 Tax=Zymoseptoria tritici ST99CH_1E4 TaxID=1276532 RepID=A0A2H1FKI3_ZYMTR|nr:unnamed protein product [Zymoseptoria tritici ST99CH_1E4]